MRRITTIISAVCVLGLINCTEQSQADRIVDDNNESINEKDTVVVAPIILENYFTRDSIEHRIGLKIANNDVRVIHVYVPLCDNEFQGIVPVNASLGDGANLHTNLYWGAGYGIKTHFKRSRKWRLLESRYNIDSSVLERIILKHTDLNVVLIADAYRGDMMGPCVVDYFNTIAGLKGDTLTVGDTTISLTAVTDLVVFNGHNGLMDVTIDTVYNKDGRTKDAVAIACASYDYYVEYLNCAGGYPLVLTANLLAPEAYVLDHVLDAWIKNKSEEEIRFAAAQGYHSIQKCGIRGASNLFVTGWEP